MHDWRVSFYFTSLLVRRKDSDDRGQKQYMEKKKSDSECRGEEDDGEKLENCGE